MSNDHKTESGKSHTDNYHRHVDGEIRVSGQVKADLPPDFVEEYKTANRDETSRENKRFIVE
jgi:hypothetical protein